MKQIADYQIEIQADFPEYWQGVGVSYTSWDHVITGCGFTCGEAFDDCLEQIAMGDIEIPEDLESHEFNFRKEMTACDFMGTTDTTENEETPLFYVSVFFNIDYKA